jgi:parvulin-like peptidyl-prolyl isomerase
MLPNFSSFLATNDLNSSGLHLFQASTTTLAVSGGVTWAAVVALASLIIGTVLTLILRRRDKETEALKPGYKALGDLLRALDKLADKKVAVVSDHDAMSESISEIKQATESSPKIRFDRVVDQLDEFEKDLLPNDYAKQLVRNRTLAEQYLQTAQRQGLAIETTRQAIRTIQRKLERRMKR